MNPWNSENFGILPVSCEAMGRRRSSLDVFAVVHTEYSRVAELGGRLAQLNIGIIYAQGWHLPQDYATAAGIVGLQSRVTPVEPTDFPFRRSH